jgi:hypothetical protein
LAACRSCGATIGGLRRLFCSIKCKQADINHRLQSYSMQQQRGRERKLHLIRLLGGACQRCGYRRNHAAIAFHHRSPESKSFQLDLRHLSNRTWQRVLDEVAKCDLLCSNCHLEVHNPDCAMTPEMVAGAVDVRARRRYVRRLNGRA